MINIGCVYASGAAMSFIKQDDGLTGSSIYNVCIVPNSDGYSKKEIIALTDGNRVTKGNLILRPINKADEILTDFCKWAGGAVEPIQRLSDFFDNNLSKKELKMNKSIRGKVGTDGAEIEGEYSVEESNKD